MKSLKTLMAAAIALSLSPLASIAGTPDEYQFELLVYAHINKAGIQSAYWAPSLPGHYIDNEAGIELKPVIDLATGDYPTLTRLPKSAWTMAQAQKKIEQKIGGKILYHAAWRVKRNELIAKRLSFALNNDPDQTAEQTDQMTGTLSVKLTRYFNNHLSLSFTVPSSEITPYLMSKHGPCNTAGHCHLKLDQKRRTRSGLVNYFDHPLFGALLVITKQKQPTTQ